MRLQGCTATDPIPYLKDGVSMAESRIWGDDRFGREERERWVRSMRSQWPSATVATYERDIKAGGFRLPVLVAIAHDA